MNRILTLTAEILMDRDDTDFINRLETLRLRANALCVLGYRWHYRETIDHIYSMRTFEGDEFRKAIILKDVHDCPFGPYSDSEPIVLPLAPLQARLSEGFAETPCQNDYGDQLPIEVLRIRKSYQILPSWEWFWADLRTKIVDGKVDPNAALHSLSDYIQYPVFDERKTWLDQISDFDANWAEALVMDDFADAPGLNLKTWQR
jgi:hypothetical protein